MRLVRVYLIGYAILVLGALAALWYGGVLQQLPPAWIVTGLAIAAGLGIALAMATPTPRDSEPVNPEP